MEANRGIQAQPCGFENQTNLGILSYLFSLFNDDYIDRSKMLTPDLSSVQDTMGFSQKHSTNWFDGDPNQDTSDPDRFLYLTNPCLQLRPHNQIHVTMIAVLCQG